MKQEEIQTTLSKTKASVPLVMCTLLKYQHHAHQKGYHSHPEFTPFHELAG